MNGCYEVDHCSGRVRLNRIWVLPKVSYLAMLLIGAGHLLQFSLACYLSAASHVRHTAYQTFLHVPEGLTRRLL